MGRGFAAKATEALAGVGSPELSAALGALTDTLFDRPTRLSPRPARAAASGTR